MKKIVYKSLIFTSFTLLGGCAMFQSDAPRPESENVRVVEKKTIETPVVEDRKVVKYKYGSNLVGTVALPIDLHHDDAAYKDDFVESVNKATGYTYAWIGVGNEGFSMVLSAFSLDQLPFDDFFVKLKGYAEEKGAEIATLPSNPRLRPDGGELVKLSFDQDEIYAFPKGNRIVVVRLKGDIATRAHVWEAIGASYESDF